MMYQGPPTNSPQTAWMNSEMFQPNKKEVQWSCMTQLPDNPTWMTENPHRCKYCSSFAPAAPSTDTCVSHLRLDADAAVSALEKENLPPSLLPNGLCQGFPDNRATLLTQEALLSSLK